MAKSEGFNAFIVVENKLNGEVEDIVKGMVLGEYFGNGLEYPRAAGGEYFGVLNHQVYCGTVLQDDDEALDVFVLPPSLQDSELPLEFSQASDVCSVIEGG